ncbi:MAG: hypothetical protein ACXWYO_09305, partial [Gaiellaceae bacterium]
MLGERQDVALVLEQDKELAHSLTHERAMRCGAHDLRKACVGVRMLEQPHTAASRCVSSSVMRR